MFINMLNNVDHVNKETRQVVKYVQGQFKVPTTPMEFISMDLIGEFHPPSSKGHK